MIDAICGSWLSVLKELEDEGHDFLKHLFFLFGLNQLVQKVLVDSPLFLLLFVKLGKFVLQPCESAKHLRQSLTKLACVFFHLLHLASGWDTRNLNCTFVLSFEDSTIFEVSTGPTLRVFLVGLYFEFVILNSVLTNFF